MIVTLTYVDDNDSFFFLSHPSTLGSVDPDVQRRRRSVGQRRPQYRSGKPDATRRVLEKD